MTHLMRTPRGFVMPMVLLVALVIGMMVAVAMRRQSAQSLTVARQVNRYQEHHGALGLQSALHVWLSSLNAREVADSLGPFGHALDLELADGSSISVYLRSGQGTALADLTGATAPALGDGVALLEQLNNDVPEQQFKRLTRRVGPIAIDANTIAEPTLRAAALVIAGDAGRAEQLVTEILALQSAASAVTRTNLVSASSRIGFDRDERARLLRLLTGDARLWFATVEIREGIGRGRLVARYGGLTLLRQPGADRASLEESLRAGAFVSWDDLGLGAETDPSRME